MCTCRAPYIPMWVCVCRSAELSKNKGKQLAFFSIYVYHMTHKDRNKQSRSQTCSAYAATLPPPPSDGSSLHTEHLG